MQQEHQREMEGLLDNIRQLSQELRLQMLIIDSFIPPEFQQMIEQYVHWNEDIGEWQLVCALFYFLLLFLPVVCIHARTLPHWSVLVVMNMGLYSPIFKFRITANADVCACAQVKCVQVLILTTRHTIIVFIFMT